MLLNQTLHGYSDGHQLLATSVNLTREQESQLLVMSDLSGPTFRRGFDSYLTAYPLAGGGIYCFARTWFATELPRPGCVWTHTLLVQDQDLARIDEIHSLESFFLRPQEAFEIERYSSGIDVGVLSTKGALNFEPSSSTLIRHLYGTEAKIVVPSETSSRYEQLVLSIFSQQWPRLRRSFSFCTGALSLRDTDFDISVSPTEITSGIGKNGAVVRLDQSLSDEPEAWVEIAARDLDVPHLGTGFREFLWHFGPDYGSGREAFRPLAEIYLTAKGQDLEFAPDRLLSAIAHFFPNQDTGRRLKSEFFGSNNRFGHVPHSEALMLRALVSHPAAEAIPIDSAELYSRARALAHKDVGAAIGVALIANQVGGRLAESFLDGFFASSDWPGKLLKKIPLALLFTALENHPEIVLRAEVWRRSPKDQLALASHITSRQIGSDLSVTKLIWSIIDARAWDSLNIVLDKFGPDAIGATLDWIDASQNAETRMPSALVNLLSTRTTALNTLLGERKMGLRSLYLLSAVLDPRSRAVRKINASRWGDVASGHGNFLDAPERLRSDVFLLCIGLNVGSEVGAKLTSARFSDVYEAVLHSRLPDFLWDELEASLPWVSQIRDRAAHLIRGVLKAFIDHSWAGEDFLETFGEGERLERALGELRHVWGGRRFLRNLKERVARGSLQGGAKQLAIIKGTGF